MLTIPGVMTGDEARTVRRGLKLSARRVGEEVGTTESSIYRWEQRHGSAVPRMYERALRDLVREISERGRDNGGSRAVKVG